MYELWEEMRHIDRQLSDEVLEPVFIFMRAQTAKERLSIENLHDYLQYRQDDVGQAYVSSLSLELLLLTTQTIGRTHEILI